MIGILGICLIIYGVLTLIDIRLKSIRNRLRKRRSDQWAESVLSRIEQESSIN